MNRITVAFHILIMTLMFVMIGLIFGMHMNVTGETHSRELLDFSDGWVYQDMSPADLGNLRSDGDIVLYNYSLTSSYRENHLCMRSKNINFSVYLNDELIYEFNPRYPQIFGRSYGNYVHSILLPPKRPEEEIVLSIVADPIYRDGTEFFKDVYIDQQGVYINEQIQGRFAHFFVCQLIFLIGVFLFSIGFYFTLRVQKRMQTMALGLVAILSGMWAGMETLYLQLITGNAAACHFINYLTLIFLPVPAILLVANITSSEKSRAILLINAMVFVNAAAQILCTLKGICDYHQMLWITHSVIIFTGLTSIFLAARSIHQHRENLTKYRMIIGAFSLFLVTGIIDIIRYHQGMSYGTFFTAGIFIFVVYLGCFEVRELVRMAEESAHAAELDRLAHMDGLTGLKNRLAFGEYEETICKSDSTYTIMQFDVNNLKKVNDEFGHNAGDKHICAAARIISDSFGALGHVFRTGGDEFIAILGITSDAEALSHSMECFSQYIEDYNVSENPPVMLSIAVGMAEFRGETNALNEAESLADQRMYTNKKQLKGLA